MKKVAIIPIALGSTRVKNKNLLLVDGEPLLFYVLRAINQADCFDEVYVDTEHEEFKWMAEKFGVKFRLRNPEMGGSNCQPCGGGRCQTHDHFLTGFMHDVETDYVVQIHTTSPLIKPETIQGFVKDLENYDSLIGCEEHYIETLVGDKEVNFNKKKKQPTQTLEPIKTVSWAICGWSKQAFLNNLDNGPTFSGNVGFHKISQVESFDVDSPEQLFVVEACLSHRKRSENVGKQYLDTKRTEDIERDLHKLIAEDGSPILSELKNRRKTNIKTLRDKVGFKSTAFPVIWTDNDQIFLIQQAPDEGCRYHYHPTKDEFWVIFEGSFKYEIEGDKEPTIAEQGDIIYIPKGVPHKMTCVGDKIGVRLACGENYFSHVYVSEE